MTERDALLAGRYHLTEIIASGGSAFVYRAVDERTGQTVAVKILKPEFTRDDEFIQRFKKEVQASLKLHHANIIRGYDAGLDNGRYYIVMELISGETLKAYIQKTGALDVKYAVSVAKKLCLALEYAHVKGFIHRDIKPHNVMIDANGEPYIADFGIARNIASNTITADENSVMGSVHYFSPEQARGERVDKRTDIYSMGILLYEMLTGNVPFDADSSIAIALKHINEPMPDLHISQPGVPESLNRIIQKATQKDKYFRYKTPFSMYEDLMRALTDTDGEYVKYTESKRSKQHLSDPRSVRAKNKPQPHAKEKKTRKLLVGVLVAGASAVVIGAATLAAGKNPVPLVVGVPSTDAIQMISEAGFEPVVIEEISDEPVGHVIRQAPAQGSTARTGSEVELFVSQGAGTDLMPNVTDMPLQQAQAILREMGLSVTVQEEPLGTYSVGYVMKQDPLPGTSVVGLHSAILTVKTTPEGLFLEVPDVQTLGLEQGLSELNYAGFSQYYVYQLESAEREPGIIVRQNPLPGNEQPSGHPVSLYVSATDSTEYQYPGDVTVRVDRDNTAVVVGIRQETGGSEMYTVIGSAVLDKGLHTIRLDTIVLDSSEPRIEAEMTILLDDVPAQDWQVELERAG